MRDKISRLGSNLYSIFLDIISPAQCSYCKKLLAQQTLFCSTCESIIQPIVSTSLAITKKKQVTIFAVSPYQGPLKKLILAKGWSDRLSSRQLGQLIWERTIVSHLDFDYIVPIPLHWTRYAWRGYNQAEEIAYIISKKSGKPLVSLLKRIRYTPFQSTLNTEGRSNNVANAFTLNKKVTIDLKNKRILLIDDLMTTGATLKEAAKLLYTCKKVATIDAVVACRVI